MDHLPPLFLHELSPEELEAELHAEQDYRCNACAEPFRGPQRLGDFRCPSCGSPPPFAVMLDLAPARAESSARAEITVGAASAAGALGMTVVIDHSTPELGTHGPAPDLVPLVGTPHVAQARPHIEPLATEAILVVVAVGAIAGAAYTAERVRYCVRRQRP